MKTSRSCLEIEPQEVESVPGMKDLVDSIQSYVNPANPMNGPKNVAIIFAATVLALRNSGVEPATDGADSQHFAYVYRGNTFRVLLSKHNKGLALDATRSQERIPTPKALTLSRRGVTRSDRLAAAKQACHRHVQLLVKTLSIATVSQTRGEGHARASVRLASCLEGGSGSGSGSGSGNEAGPTTTATGITIVLDELLDRETESHLATRRVYYAYAQLGRAFGQLVKESHTGMAPRMETKEFHQVGLPILESAMTGWPRRRELSHAALLKRLERARKIFLLVQYFGGRVLDSPGLTMRLVDRTSFRPVSCLFNTKTAIGINAPETGDIVDLQDSPSSCDDL